jgi:hypothetical protein
LIERAYTTGERLGLQVWVEDEAGPYRTQPYQGQQWQPEGHPVHLAHEYKPNGTAKMLTLFRPATGELHMKGSTSSANAILHPWLEQELRDILAHLPEPETMLDAATNRARWESWQKDLKTPIRLPDELPQLRVLLVWDNLKGHHSKGMVDWLIQHGVLPLYTPLGGSWLNMAESIQRIIKRRALDGQHPTTPDQIIDWLEATSRAWNAHPTPFVWGGKRQARRRRARARRLHRLGGSGACSTQPISVSNALLPESRCAQQMTH